MIRCLAVDDEEDATDIIAAYIKKIPFLSLYGTTTSAVEALSIVQQGNVDLVFMDIQMPELTGIQFLKLYGNACPVILTTAYPQHALEGYEYHVIDYLVKPFEFERFLKAARKAYALIHPRKSGDSPTGVADTGLPAKTENAGDYIFVKGDNKNKFLKINFSQILFIEALKNYVSIYTTEGTIVTYQSISELEMQLPTPPFCRVHRSFIVSIDKIEQVQGNTVYVSGYQVPVGESYRQAFFKFVKS